ncbi:hypothetical protein OIV83_004694 [Microbotryomycetes sp. JL201]|nr:hypothetical protein OIV83_004694 [Microbotryomycetes sp. JL201]
MSASLEITYELSLPKSFQTTTTKTEPTSTIAIALDTSTPRQHLLSLETALAHARKQANEQLTQWKDAVKDLDNEKHRAKGRKGNKEDDENDEDDQDQDSA